MSSLTRGESSPRRARLVRRRRESLGAVLHQQEPVPATEPGDAPEIHATAEEVHDG